MEIDQELRREMIVENYEHPYHKGLKKEAGYLVANTNNESCIDNIDIELKIEDGKIKEANLMVKLVQFLLLQHPYSYKG